MGDEKHPYVVIGGGDEQEIHNPSKVVSRPAHLKFDPQEAKFCTVQGGDGKAHKIFYEVHGTGPKKMLALQGLAGCHTQYVPQYEHFGVKKGDEYTIVVTDNRGVGFSETPGSLWRTSDIANDHLQLLMHLEKSDEPGAGPSWGNGVHLLGFSMGGMVAQELVLLAPSRFGSLTLISTHGGGLLGTLPPPRGLPIFLKTFGALGGVKALDAGIELLYPLEHLEEAINPLDHGCGEHEPEVPLTTNRLRIAHNLIVRARKYREAIPDPEIHLSGVVRQLSAVLSHYISWERLEKLRSYKLEVLVVSGEKDNLVGSWNGRLLAEALCGRWLHFTEAGHGVSEQFKDQVNEAIETAIDKAQQRIQETPHLLAHRKPMPPGTHPFKVFAAAFLGPFLAICWSRGRASKRGFLLSLLIAGTILRRKYGGFFAK